MNIGGAMPAVGQLWEATDYMITEVDVVGQEGDGGVNVVVAIGDHGAVGQGGREMTIISINSSNWFTMALVLRQW